MDANARTRTARTLLRITPVLFVLAVLSGGALSTAVAAPPPPASAPAATTVDINSAALEELNALPGIGPALAQRIVDYRREHGPFKSVDDLLAVKGIGPKMLAKIRDRLTVGQPKVAK